MSNTDYNDDKQQQDRLPDTTDSAVASTGDEVAADAGEGQGFVNPYGGGPDVAGPGLAGNGGWAAEGASIGTGDAVDTGLTPARDGTSYPG
jgi:hypothetical protein